MFLCWQWKVKNLSRAGCVSASNPESAEPRSQLPATEITANFNLSSSENLVCSNWWDWSSSFLTAALGQGSGDACDHVDTSTTHYIHDNCLIRTRTYWFFLSQWTKLIRLFKLQSKVHLFTQLKDSTDYLTLTNRELWLEFSSSEKLAETITTSPSSCPLGFHKQLLGKRLFFLSPCSHKSTNS